VAGTASIKTVENKGAVPPGIYKPIFLNWFFLASNLRLHRFTSASVFALCEIFSLLIWQVELLPLVF
jgi:hypothetical protein